ncbi:uncharacterized protein MELLADRAFT_50370 [Melampsora larici-populina 98AG31]|uniref:Squalene synthase n=1 Tax=Melampsora larici-populina (strain 98AG31 / pathotype 3-4-7) TaxID=747676 RepID=F4S485_MELLP|nr:uncharacterized protein MELLADRAFT_50370 [Melampsora larici-populina 98AG31]EGG00549.1 hypothetical protein MELLADRAFT_50370 [Melampsora larici-populina 98AG31]
MPSIRTIGEFAWLAVTHPKELKAVVNYKIWHEPRSIEDDPEASRIHYKSMKECWTFLDQTSRSFSAVIKQLEGELSRVICIFYLILRGMDTIEDDMTIEIKLKEKILKTFYQKLEEPGWRFDGCGPDAKDRHLLLGFDSVIEEFQLLDPSYRNVISEVTARMGSGMSQFSRMAYENQGIFSIDTMTSFDSYCHYVAGLVGEGLSRLFAQSNKEDSMIGHQLTLSNSMGLLLQKTNILRDFREDVDDGRMFWPKEIWNKYVEHPKDLTKPENLQKARWALTEMTIDALSHSTDALEYMTMLKNQSIFNFCAIPQVMAIATLEKCFDNLDVFHKNVKIRRSMTVDLMMKAVNPRDLAYIFVDFTQKIHSRARPDDPNYLKLSIIVAQVSLHSQIYQPSIIIFQPLTFLISVWFF